MGGNKYEILMDKAQKCFKQMGKVKGMNLKTFWYSAYKGYEQKARSLKLTEVV